MAYEQHITSAKAIIARFAIITLSDTRTIETDTSGQLIQKLLAESGHQTASYQIIKDDPRELSPMLQKLLSDPTIDVILTNGGTGIAKRDQTIDVIEKILEKPLTG